MPPMQRGLQANGLVSQRVQKAVVMTLVVLALMMGVWIGLLVTLAANTNVGWARGAPAHLSFMEGNAGQILLPAVANGTEVGPCLLDSGAQATMMMISSTAARRASLKVFSLLPWSVAHGSYGSTGLVPNRTADEFQVGPIVLRRSRLVELPDADMPTGAGPIGSICSLAILQGAAVEIDWRSERISFYEPEESLRQFEALEWMPLVEYQGLPFVRLTVEGKHEGLFLVDTGMTSAIHFFSHSVEKYQLLANRTVGYQVRKGVGGSATVLAGEIEGMTLGHYQVGPLVASFDTVERNRKERKVSGRIGLAVLRQFRTIIDMPNNRIAFIAY